MTGSRKVLLVIVALAVLADFLPVTREELSWWWAESHDHASDYLSYLSGWPKGRHAPQARSQFLERQRVENKREQIREAPRQAAATDSAAAAAYRKEQNRRQEFISWKRASVSNTVDSYNGYIRQYPNGKYAAQARGLIESLSRGGSPAGTPPPQ